MKSKSQFPDALKLFCKEVGVPNTVVVDPSGQQTSNKIEQFCHNVGTTLRVLEEHTQWANRAELYIDLIKEAIHKEMRASHYPVALWDYCAEYKAQVHNLTAKDLFQLQGQTPYTATTGNEADISHICNFGWYDWCYYRDQKEPFPMPKGRLGRVLGPAKNYGNMMTQWILTSNGTIVPLRTLRRLQEEELYSPTETQKRDVFSSLIQAKLGDSMSPPPEPPDDSRFDEATRNDEVSRRTMPENEITDCHGTPLYQQSIVDKLIGAEVLLPQGEAESLAKVVRRCVYSDGKVTGAYDDNPVLNT